MKLKILSIVGARPNFVKAAPISHRIELDTELHHIILHTGQHYDHNLSNSFIEELNLPSLNYNLEIGSGRQGWQLGEMIKGIDDVIHKEAPDVIIVYGDTNSTAAGAIAGAKNNVPVAHIEAGLREFNKKIPEEINKLLITASTDLYFCPTQTGVENLKKSGITNNVYLVGDIGIDLIKNNIDKINSNKNILNKYNLRNKEYFLITCHRAANTSDKDKLKNILEVINTLEEKIVFPIHPRTLNAIKQFGYEHYINADNIIITKPLKFFDIQSLVLHAKAVITDSGGIVKEAYYHKTPGIIIDTQIEWLETINEGWNHLAGTNKSTILSIIKALKTPNTHTNCLGNGTASIKILKIIKDYIKVA